MNLEEMQQKIKERGISFLPFHECSMCRYKCGYIIFEGDVEYDNGCYCVKYSGVRPSSWDELWNGYTCQSDEGKQRLLDKWGLT